jgi:hemerythrin-like domain-containing protein
MYTFGDMKITDALLAEHVVFHNIFDHIENVVPKLKTLAEVKGWAGLMEGLLLAHGQAEEDLVFAPLNHYLEQIGQRDTFEHEHQEIDNSLLRVKAAKRLPEARQLLLQAVTASRKHFDREERIVFPLAERVMKKETLIELGKVWMKQRNAELA